MALMSASESKVDMSTRLIRKMKLPALLALDIVDGAIRGFLDSLSV
jgi:hypothetical protein